MRNLSQLWNGRPWRRKKQDEGSHTAEDSAPAPISRTREQFTTPEHAELQVDRSLTATIGRNAKRLSQVWKQDESTSAPPSRTNSLKHIKNRRSLFKPNDESMPEEDTNSNAPRDTLLTKLRRRSQNMSTSMQRPQSSSGVASHRSMFGGTIDWQKHEVPAMPSMPDLSSHNRPRHIPITIDHLAKTGDENLSTPLAESGPGMAITSNDVHSPGHAFSEKPRGRPMSSSSSFSQLRTRAARPVFQSTQGTRDSESSDEDILTALPSLDFKDFHIGELKAPSTYNNAYSIPLPNNRQSIHRADIPPPPSNRNSVHKVEILPSSNRNSIQKDEVAPPSKRNSIHSAEMAAVSNRNSFHKTDIPPSIDRHSIQTAPLAAKRNSLRTAEVALPANRHTIQRVTPKVVDIVAPRPLTMFSSQPIRRSATTKQERHKTMAPPTTTPIGPLEDGPKGDWSRTRHSWVGTTDADSEQLEWDKLKQFMEAYGNGQDGGIITVRAVDTDSSNSSGSARNSHGAKFSNAQALAALEFGLA